MKAAVVLEVALSVETPKELSINFSTPNAINDGATPNRLRISSIDGFSVVVVFFLITMHFSV